MPPRTKSVRVVACVRKVNYPFRENVHRLRRPNHRGIPKIKFVNDPGGSGHETVQEIIVCPSCAGQH